MNIEQFINTFGSKYTGLKSKYIWRRLNIKLCIYSIWWIPVFWSHFPSGSPPSTVQRYEHRSPVLLQLPFFSSFESSLLSLHENINCIYVHDMSWCLILIIFHFIKNILKVYMWCRQLYFYLINNVFFFYKTS